MASQLYAPIRCILLHRSLEVQHGSSWQDEPDDLSLTEIWAGQKVVDGTEAQHSFAGCEGL
jgi:hypothetical protein